MEQKLTTIPQFFDFLQTVAVPDPVIREASHISHSNQASPMFINFWRKYKIQYISIYKMV